MILGSNSSATVYVPVYLYHHTNLHLTLHRGIDLEQICMVTYVCTLRCSELETKITLQVAAILLSYKRFPIPW